MRLKVGMIFSSCVTTMTAVCSFCAISFRMRSTARARTRSSGAVGSSARMTGEQQRISIARGLVNRPPVILADEPTAPLDSVRALAVIRILNEMAQKLQTAVIVVTHDEKIIPTFKRIYHIRDGVTHEEAGEGRTPWLTENPPGSTP